MAITVRFSLGAANTGLLIGDLTIYARTDADAAMDQTGATLQELTAMPGRYSLVLPAPTASGHVRVFKTGSESTVWWEGDVAVAPPTAAENRTEMDGNSTQLAQIATDTGTTIPAAIAAISITLSAQDITDISELIAAAVIAAGEVQLSPGQIQSAAYAAIVQYDTSHSAPRLPGTDMTVSGLVGAASVVGPRQPLIVRDLWDEIRLGLRDKNKNNYPDPLMAAYHNRAVAECWHLMIQIGADIVINTGTIITDGIAADYELPEDFRAFVPGMVMPRNPVTGTSDYDHGKAFTQVGMLNKAIKGAPTTSATPTHFAIFWGGNSQYIRFSSVPPAGEYYDFCYYPEPGKVTAQNCSNTYTPWLGLLDTLLARILEEFCLDGLEFITTKHAMWRAKAEADIVMLLGLRLLNETKNDPSMWVGFPS